MELTGAQKLEGRDIRRRKRRGTAAERKPTAELVSVLPCNTNLIASWHDLAENVCESNIFYEHWFLKPALEQFNRNRDLRFFLLWAGEPNFSALLGLFPVGPSNKFGRWPVPHIQNWMHHNSFLGTPLVREGYEQIFWHALLDELDGAKWPGFLHINGLTIGGPLDTALRQVCAEQVRRCDLVHSEARAILISDLAPSDYYSATVRGKKRKELRRQAKRLSELGDVQFARHDDDRNLSQWTEEFLDLEQAGWKGQNGSALNCMIETAEFFRETLRGAAKSGQLERHDVRLDGKPLAMLVNFLSAPGSFSFKTTFDENYSRFSPGVLLQTENLNILNNPAVKWMDSCASEGHPMIDSLWSGRRHIGRFSIELSGLSRKTMFRGVRIGEDLMANIKGREIVDVSQVAK